jgi:hypothetical protein
VAIESLALHAIIFAASLAGIIVVLANFHLPIGADKILYQTMMNQLLRPFTISAVFSMALEIVGLGMSDYLPSANLLFLIIGVLIIIVFVYEGFRVLYKIFPHRHSILPQAPGTPTERIGNFINALDIESFRKQILVRVYEVYLTSTDDREKKKIAKFFVQTLFSPL